MTPTPYTPHGRAHRLLQRLAKGDCGFVAIVQAVHGGVLTENRRKKLWRLLDILAERDLVARVDRDFFITPAGEAELERLEQAAGNRGNVRLFVEVAA